MTKRYTLLEMMIVIVVLCLLSGLVLSRLSGTPKRLLVESALNDIHEAFREAASRARATGRVAALILTPENRQLVSCEVYDDLEIFWHPPILHSEDDKGKMESSDNNNVFELSDAIEWRDLPESLDWGGITGIRYLFFPDGEAAGPDVAFELYGRQFFWKVDRMLGTMTIYEE